MSEKELDYEYPNMLKFVLTREGGYVNDKDDPGGVCRVNFSLPLLMVDLNVQDNTPNLGKTCVV